MNNRLLVPQKLPLLLDYAPNAAAAYSLRSLSNSYVGPVVTVRRSTDSAERDFTSTEVSDGTLAAWCGGGDGFVKTWHDQSQHGRDASQSTAGYQPQIVASGVVILEGGKPAVLFDGVDDRLAGSPLNFNAAVSKLSVACVKAGTHMQIRSVGNGNNLEFQSTDVNIFTAGASYSSASFSSTERFLITAAINSLTTFQSKLNGALLESLTGIGPTDDVFASNINIGFRETDAGTSQQKPLGSISELIFWVTSDPVNLTAVEGDLAWYY